MPSPVTNEAFPKAVRIMVVEDVAFNLEIISLILAGRGWQVMAARSGEAALAILASDRNFQAILMDLGLPGIDGIQTTREIKSNPLTSAIPVLALTAEPAGEAQRILEAGFDGYLEKDFDPDRLAAELNRHLAPVEPAPGKSSPARPEEKAAGHLDFAALSAAYPNEATVRRMATAFFADANLELSRLAGALAAEDLAAVRAGCHGIMGAAAIFKAGNLGLAAAELATCARQGDKTRLAPAWRRVLAAHAALRQIVLARLDLPVPGFPPSP